MSTARIELVSAPPPVIPQGPLRLGYRPCLDGLRAFAVLVVMAHHAYIPFFRGGGVGVDLFFVLSGFLITSLLLEEWRKTGDISLRKFYVRRALRLLPALAVFLVFIELGSLALLRGARLWEMQKVIVSVIFYVGNWVRAFQLLNMGNLSHTWSLSIEEQFYLIWPLLFLLLLRKVKSERWILGLLGLAILLIAVKRATMWVDLSSVKRIYNGSDTRCDELLTGCVLGVLLHLRSFPIERVRAVMRFILPVAALPILAAIVDPGTQRMMCTIGWPVIAVSAAAVILGLLLGSAGPLQGLFESRPAVWIGRLSYGLYLWHVPILAKAAGWYFLGPFRVVAGFALTFAAAATSYYLVELRFLRRKQHFASA